MRERQIKPEMNVLDALSQYRQAEAVLKKCDEQAGICLFETAEGSICPCLYHLG